MAFIRVYHKDQARIAELERLLGQSHAEIEL
jgi:hypothetical protein